MTDEIDIGYTPNCNAATTHMRRIDGEGVFLRMPEPRKFTFQTALDF